MNYRVIGKQILTNVSQESVLRKICGSAFLMAAIGVFTDEYQCGGCEEGSLGLIPLYLGFLIGSVAFVPVIYKATGWIPAVIAMLGLGGMWYFMGTYPDGASGWIGAILIGVAHLYLPISGRFAAIFWVASGTLGFPEFHAQSWGIIRPYTLFGTAVAMSGIFVLVGLKGPSEDKAK